MANESVDKVLAEALKLPSQARAALAGRLLESLDPDDDQDDVDDEVELAWMAEVERRDRELESGALRAVPLAEAERLIASDDD